MLGTRYPPHEDPQQFAAVVLDSICCFSVLGLYGVGNPRAARPIRQPLGRGTTPEPGAGRGGRTRLALTQISTPTRARFSLTDVMTQAGWGTS